MYFCHIYFCFIMIKDVLFCLPLYPSDEGGRSEMLRQHSHTDPSSAAYGTFLGMFWEFACETAWTTGSLNVWVSTCMCVCVFVRLYTDSGSSVQGGSPALSRLVPGHRLWADRHGRHVLGLIEDYSALSKQIREAKRITAAMDKQLQDRVTH